MLNSQAVNKCCVSGMVFGVKQKGARVPMPCGTDVNFHVLQCGCNMVFFHKHGVTRERRVFL